MKNPYLTGIIGLVLGIFLSLFFIRQPNNTNTPSPSPIVMNHTGTTMQDMVHNLKGKSGDDFDKAFISEMIEHHMGAIEMAKEASVSAKHPEIKEMSQTIISSQSQEIDQMKEWQKNWNY